MKIPTGTRRYSQRIRSRPPCNQRHDCVWAERYSRHECCRPAAITSQSHGQFQISDWSPHRSLWLVSQWGLKLVTWSLLSGPSIETSSISSPMLKELFDRSERWLKTHNTDMSIGTPSAGHTLCGTSHLLKSSSYSTSTSSSERKTKNKINKLLLLFLWPTLGNVHFLIRGQETTLT